MPALTKPIPREAFAQAMAAGINHIVAAKAAGYAEPHNYRQFADRPRIAKRIEDIRRERAWGGARDLGGLIDAAMTVADAVGSDGPKGAHGRQGLVRAGPQARSPPPRPAAPSRPPAAPAASSFPALDLVAHPTTTPPSPRPSGWPAMGRRRRAAARLGVLPDHDMGPATGAADGFRNRRSAGRLRRRPWRGPRPTRRWGISPVTPASMAPAPGASGPPHPGRSGADPGAGQADLRPRRRGLHRRPPLLRVALRRKSSTAATSIATPTPTPSRAMTTPAST